MRPTICTALLLILATGCASALEFESAEDQDAERLEDGNAAFTQPIVGGSVTPIDTLPWQVQVVRLGPAFLAQPFSVCGGSLIAKNWVLTAAHCIDDEYPLSDYSVVAGTSIISGNGGPGAGGQLLSPARVIIHPGYSGGKSDGDDIALIELQGEFTLGDSVATIAVVDAAAASRGVTQPGELATLSGWGRTSTNGPDPTNLMSITVPIVATRDVSGAYFTTFDHRFITAGPLEGGKGACNGDSGGPMVVGVGTAEPLLAGVTSYASRRGCAAAGAPAMYTRVEAFVPWIKQHVAVRTSTAPPSQFSDVNEYPGALEIFNLTQGDVLSGYPDGTFQPRRVTTRAEVAAVIAKAFGQGNRATSSPFPT